MNQNAQSILEVAAQLPEAERIQIVEGLLITLEPTEHDTPEDIEEAWRAELIRRASELDRGVVKAIPWSVVLAEGESMFHGRD